MTRSQQTTETRKDAAKALGAASAAVHPDSTGIGGKVAMVGTIIRLARRYPMAALVVGGVALALYVGSRQRYGSVVR